MGPGSFLRRIHGLAVLLASLLVACGGSSDGSGGAPRPQSAILISIDTLRPDYLGCYGHPRDTSPALDALAARGVRFEDVTAAAPWTLPSHATMLTGLYPTHHAVTSHQTRLPESIVTLAEEFRAQGFRTCAVVNTWNVGAPQFQLGQGFDSFHYVEESEIDSAGRHRTRNSAREILDKAKEFLEADTEHPFFLFLHFYDVHTDFTPRLPYRQQFVEPYEGRMTGRTGQLVTMRLMGESLAPDEVRFLRQMYEAEIRQLDDALGRFFAWLDERGRLADALLAVTSDHGEEFQEHGGLLHGRTQYQEVLRIPLLIAGPGVPAGLVIPTPVHGVDVTPSLLGIMGIRSDVPRDGLDLSVLWHGGSLPDRPLFGEADHNNEVEGQTVSDTKRMVREGSEKLLFDQVSGGSLLFDLAADPGETQDLAGARPQRAHVLLEALERFRAGARAPDSIPEPSAEEQSLLDDLGYGGDTDDDGK